MMFAKEMTREQVIEYMKCVETELHPHRAALKKMQEQKVPENIIKKNLDAG